MFLARWARLALRYLSWLLPLAALLVLLELAVVRLAYPNLLEHAVARPIYFSLRLLASAAAALAALGVAAALAAAALEPRLGPRRAAGLAGAAMLGLCFVGAALPALLPNFFVYSFPSYRVVVSAAVLAGLALAAWLLGTRLFRAMHARRPGPLAASLAAAVGLAAAAGAFGPGGLRDLPADAGPRPPRAAPALGAVPLVLITIDTLRASNLSLYGHPVETSPGIDAWAAGEVVFDHALTPKTGTVPALASLFTGALPTFHGVAHNGSQLDAGFATLAELLRERGYRTAAFVANPLAEKGKLDQGFDEFKAYPKTADGRGATADEVLADAGRWLRDNRREPFLLWVHLLDPHSPYVPPVEYRDRFAGDPFYERYARIPYAIRDSFPFGFLAHVFSPHLAVAHGHGAYSLSDVFGPQWAAILPPGNRAPAPDYVVSQYDAEIAYTDAQLAPFLELVRERARDALVILTADHGEDLGEHNVFFKHGAFAYEDTAHVPLVVSHPSFAARRVGDPVSLVDLLPTLADLLGLALPAYAEGASLAPLLEAPAGNEAPALAARELRIDAMGLASYPTLALRNERWKLVLTPLRIYFVPDALLEAQLRYAFPAAQFSPFFARHYYVELFDLGEDPDEQINQARAQPERVHDLAGHLFTWLQDEHRIRLATGIGGGGPAAVDAETRELLEALGYVHE